MNNEKSKAEITIDIISLVLIILMSIYVLLSWSKMPSEIPIHFNLAGEADGWGDKNNIFSLLGIAIAVYIILTLLQGYPDTWTLPVAKQQPLRNITLKNARNCITLVKFEIMILLAYTIIGIVNLRGLSSTSILVLLFSGIGTYTFFYLKNLNLMKGKDTKIT